jgi:hypothetical protein
LVRFTDIIKAFIQGIASSRLALIGAVITTSVFPVLLGLIILDLYGLVRGAYSGFFTYMILGPVFIIGLIMVFAGLFIFKGREKIGIFTFEYLKEQFEDPDKFNRVRKLVFLTTLLTIINIMIVTLLCYSGYHYTESVEFCGQFCHVVMDPEYTTYQNSPHSRVKCIECHIGSGAEWFVKSKISGTRQLVAVAVNSFSRPIETPVHGLRPARDTCEECHRPELFHGEKLYIKDKFQEDEKNTHVQTVLLMKIGSGGYRGQSAHGIHWHVAEENKIIYTHSDKEREKIDQVKLVKLDGSEVIFNDTESVKEESSVHGESRVMDCIDCHNRPTHVYLDPDEALDQKLLRGEIPRELPFIKKNGMEVITKVYQTKAEAKNNIATVLRAWYKENYPEIAKGNFPMLEKGIKGVQAAYEENVFPEMKIQWGTYKSFLNHKDESGCFRCHDDSHENEEGETISQDCETCHVILAEDEPAPEILKTIKGDEE